MITHSSILGGEFHGQKNLVGYRPGGCKELDMTEQVMVSAEHDFHSKTIKYAIALCQKIVYTLIEKYC